MATAVAAYLHLEGQGLIEARPRSGYFVRRELSAHSPGGPSIRPPAGPSWVSVSPGIAALMAAMQDSTVLALGATVPAAELLPLRALNRTLATLARESAEAGAGYGPLAGVTTMRQQLARRSAAWGTNLTEDDFLITVGAMEALGLALRAVTGPGDVVAVESPTYFGLLQIIETLGLRAVEIPCAPERGLDVDRLARVLQRVPVRACVCSPNFHNPTGTRMPDSRKEQLVRLLARHDLPLIEDDIYGDLSFDGARPVPARAFDRAGRVLLCGSVSKTLAPGYRVGWISPGRYRARVEQLKFAQTVASPILPQMAVAEFLGSGRYDRHLRGLRARLAAQVRRASETAAFAFPAGTRFSRPEGGFFLWIELPAEVDSMRLQTEALRARIALAPGPIFSASKGLRNFVRLSCGLPWSRRFETALHTLGALAGRQVRGRARSA